MNKKLLTVSVAAYNAEDYLREVLDSFVELPHIERIEVIVVDDGGKDSSLAIAREYEERFPDVFVPVHKENGGWGSTVNWSIAHARGKYFRLLDGDDYYSRENLKAFLDYLEQVDSDVVVTPYVRFIDGKKDGMTEYTNKDHFEENKEYRLCELSDNILVSMHAITVRTAVLQENNVRLKEKCLYRDMEYTANILTHSESVMFFNKPVYYYRLGRAGQSVSVSSFRKHMDEHADIVLDLLSMSSRPENEKKRALFYHLANGACVQQYRIFFFPGNTGSVKKKLVAFDQAVRKYPEFYQSLKLPVYCRLLRPLNFTGYSGYLKALTAVRKLKP